MKYISHRGNINNKIIEKENSISYIIDALNLGYDVEIDVWYERGFFLGHDYPIYKIDTDFLVNKKLWCHAKNLEALNELSKLQTRYFWHENDRYTITSDRIVWAYPGQKLNEQCVCVLPEINNLTHNDVLNCYGICSDYIEKWKIQ